MGRLLAARLAGDVTTVRNLYSDSEDLWTIGSDADEWYRGLDVVEISRVHWQELEIATDDLLHLEAFENGETGWALVEQRRTTPRGESFLYRLTIIFVLEAGAWKIVHVHFSAPVPNEEVTGVELNRTLSNLLNSVGGTALSHASDMSGTATLLFTDIVDSTPMSIQLGDKAWRETISTHLDAVREVVERHGGSVVKTLGDGGMYIFRSGSAALRAARDFQQALAASPEELQVRMGIHTGDVAQTEDDLFGPTVAKAARVAAAANGGQILVSATTAGMVNPNEFEFDIPITVELTGLPGTHQLRPLNWFPTGP